jgi:hypothetical protein
MIVLDTNIVSEPMKLHSNPPSPPGSIAKSLTPCI